MTTPDQHPKCRNLVLDAGPLLSLSPLRGLAETYLTTPQVLAELKDSRAREHFQRLGLLSGVKIEIRSPDAASLAHVIQWAKKTGDYAVLSHPDLCVLALTYALSEEDKKKNQKEKEEAKKEESEAQTEGTEPTTADSEAPAAPAEPAEEQSATVTIEDLADQLDETHLDESDARQADESTPADENAAAEATEADEEHLEPLDVEITPIDSDDAPEEPQPEPQPEPELEPEASTSTSTPAGRSSPSPIYDDPSDEDDGEGEWITPANVGIHKSRALNQLPDGDDGAQRKGKKAETIGAGCMTADFAMQNVLLQMGLNLVGLEGKRIERIKSWVLRCHACFKICKDNSKKFCPSCGNPTLLRASVTVSAPGAAPNAPVLQVHLKPNFQYKTRGTIYAIPQPRAGSAKTGPGTGLILREDQLEYVRAKKRADGRREREEQRVLKGVMGRGVDGRGAGAVSSWMDPDWVPEIVAAGAGGKGRTARSSGMDGDMPQIGYGRKNPNEKRRKK